jgi:hypothetical protein
MIAWALGYMTAFNEYGAKPKGDVSGGQHTEELAKWIDDYCRKTPSDSFYGATNRAHSQIPERLQSLIQLLPTADISR